ncbi:MAG: histidine kinase N-terminal domain-containing protein [Acidimicrobiales bacterium]|nr:histidine kinase N-terminal domain-containing protein [Acidimicrobiales bacterium]
MAGLEELARRSTALDDAAVDHCLQLVSGWSLLSDLSFSDLLLYAPVDASATSFVVLGHMRSVTGSTVHVADPVGSVVAADSRPQLRLAYLDGERTDGLVPWAPAHGPSRDDPTVEEDIGGIGARITVDYIPVRRDDAVIAVLARESDPQLLRHPNPVERRYRDLWERFAAMVAAGAFPLERSERVGELREPRVGDGVVVLDREQRIEYTSPNATSALHRIGVRANVVGRTLGELGTAEHAVRRAFASRHSTLEELEHGTTAVIARCHPLVEDGRVSGAVLLLRDISELRSRDKLLLSKDATIREIHHRVKNNLQTIQSLLRLQSRRLETAEAKSAIEQSARRIGSIAIVHETLAVDTADVVDFDAVAGRVVRMVEEGLGSTERPVRVEIVGTLGELGGDVAMPLAVVLTELVQNAIDHSVGAGDVTVSLRQAGKDLEMRVVDGGTGVPEGFALDRDAGLGLTIVRTFVVHDLGGSISIGRAEPSPPYGTAVEVRVPRQGPNLPVG